MSQISFRVSMIVDIYIIECIRSSFRLLSLPMLMTMLKTFNAICQAMKNDIVRIFMTNEIHTFRFFLVIYDISKESVSFCDRARCSCTNSPTRYEVEWESNRGKEKISGNHCILKNTVQIKSMVLLPFCHQKRNRSNIDCRMAINSILYTYCHNYIE